MPVMAGSRSTIMSLRVRCAALLSPVNFLFLGSEAGGERSAILYTVLESAKLNGLDPQVWLTDVIDRIARGHPINRLTELLPWNWQHQIASLAA
jgi:transposase